MFKRRKSTEKANKADKYSWKQIKENLLSLSPSEWEKRIADKGAVPLADIPTWRTYFNTNIREEPSNDVDDEKVEKLCDKVSIFRGDITKLGIDAIVNAANNRMLGGGGVDGAIHRVAGRRLYEECLTVNGCPTGEAKITGAYKLPCKYVIHTVGPMGEHPEELESCYDKSLGLMLENKLKTIAFPCISTGIYGYPSENACPVALNVAKRFLTSHGDKVDRIIFCLFLEKDIAIYEECMAEYFPVSEGKKKNVDDLEKGASKDEKGSKNRL